MITEELEIDAGTLAGWLTEKRPVTILDIRPAAEREEWSIPGSIHTDVYDKLKANDEHALDHVKLEAQTPIVTVCAGGKMSLKAAEILKQKGFEVYSLEGGMKSWNFAWNTAEKIFPHATVIQVRRSAKGCLSYLIGSENKAIVIDASLDPQVYLDLATANGWTIKYVTDTHVHADYLSRTRELASASSAKHILIDQAKVDYSFSLVKNGERLTFGNAILEAIHTPGHTLESTSFKLGEDALFTGDTLFVDGVGRPDLKADQDEALQKSKQLYYSLKQILRLTPKTMVFPAHFSKAVPFDNNLIVETIENLKRKLELLNLDETEFVKYTLSRIPPTPPNYLTIATLNKQGSYEGYIPGELEAGANRCAIA